MAKQKRIALVAHDNKKSQLLAWVECHLEALQPHHLLATGTTGQLITDRFELPIEKLQSGPLGGDLQLGAKISEGKIDLLIFFWDPLTAQPHEPDVRALLRIAVLWNIPVACNQISADLIINSGFLNKPFQHQPPDFSDYHKKSF